LVLTKIKFLSRKFFLKLKFYCFIAIVIICCQFGNAVIAKDVNWTGTSGNYWDHNTENWQWDDDPSAAFNWVSSKFADGDNVTFGSSGSPIQVALGIATGDMTVNGSGYSFEGRMISRILNNK
jgi:hypothetical protein